MTRGRERPDRVQVSYFGTLYWLDLRACRRALVQRQIQGQLMTIQALATAANLSRSTASRFFAGRSHTVSSARRILAALGLQLGDVISPIEKGSDHLSAVPIHADLPYD